MNIEHNFWRWVDAVKEEEYRFLNSEGEYPVRLVMSKEACEQLTDACYPFLLHVYNGKPVTSFCGLEVIVSDKYSAWCLE